MKVLATTVGALAGVALGHGYMTSPLPRQYREEGLGQGIEWTKWMGITVPGDGGFNPGEGNAPNLNAGIGGGPAGAEREATVGHGLCGDLGDRNGFAVGPYGRTPVRGTFPPGGTLPVSVRLTAYHAGWFEFRLCAPAADGAVTQACLNEHVLEIDPSTPFYPEILDYSGMRGINAEGDGGWYKCASSGGHADPTSNTPNTAWPSGSCCNGGGSCSPPGANTDRYVVEFASGGGVRDYDVVLKLPRDVQCDNCVLQWMYQTANSRETYPETFWNCADIAVSGQPPAPTPKPVTAAPTVGAASPSPLATAAPTATLGCSDIYESCQAHWCTDAYWASQCQATCGACGGGGGDVPATAAPTVAPVTGAPPAAPSPSPITEAPTVTSGCSDLYESCQAHWCTDAYWASQCQATCGACGSGSGGGDVPATTRPTTAVSTSTPTTAAPPTAVFTSTPTTAAPATSTKAPTSSSPESNTGGAAGWERVMSPELIAKGHPWGISAFGPEGLSGLAAATVIFEDIKTALEQGPASFADFCNSGDLARDQREAAAFLANVLKETGGYSAFTEVSPHGTYCTFNDEGGSDLQAAGQGFPCGAPFAAEGYANAFIGRGAIQLTWNINYGRFSEFYFGDRDVLLKNPELVEGDGPLGWAASLWFWMTPQDFGGQCPPKQLDSTMPLGHMSCHQAMAAGNGGMGQTIRIINGGYEACPTSAYRSSALARLEYYLGLTSLLGVLPSTSAGCQVNDATNCDLSGMERFAHTDGTIGNPLIGAEPSEECRNCKVAVCTPTAASKWLGVPDDPVLKAVWKCL